MAAADVKSALSEETSATRRRRVLRRVAAVAFGLAVILGAEMTCRLVGWGDPALREDPFVGFAGTRSLFIPSADGKNYVVPRVRQEYFAPESFPIEKSSRTRRIFCLGGSTVQGRPWSIATSFTTWLELALNIADESQDWDVVNCGGISYASYRLVPILEECLHYEPDLIILCTGHNEFLEDRSYPAVLRSPLLQRTSQLRLVNVARSLIDRRQSAGKEPSPDVRTKLTLETEPILNFNGGLAVYHRDDPWRAGVVAHYDVNLRRMVAMVRAAGVPLLLMCPSSNLRDCPPFKWEPPKTFRQDEIEKWRGLITQSQEVRDQDPHETLHLLRQALDMDAQNPLTHYQLGRIHLAMGDDAAARAAFVKARDLDVCPLRMTSRLQERLFTLAAEEHLPLLDMHALLEVGCPDGILGNDRLVDHIHPTIEGHQQIAQALVGQLEQMGFVEPLTGWESRARTAYDAHLMSLDSAYFLRGQRMLDGLRAWSQGRADGPAAADRFPGRVETP